MNYYLFGVHHTPRLIRQGGADFRSKQIGTEIFESRTSIGKQNKNGLFQYGGRYLWTINAWPTQANPLYLYQMAVNIEYDGMQTRGKFRLFGVVSLPIPKVSRQLFLEFLRSVPSFYS